MADIIVCDICDSRKNVTRQHYKTGEWVPDAAGGRSEQNVEIYDICLPCEVKILRCIISDSYHKEMISEIKRRISKKS